MKISELKTIVDYINIDKDEPIRVKINYPNGVGYTVHDIKSLGIMNGGIVLNIDVNYVPER